MGESEHGDVVITKGQGMMIVNIRPATIQHPVHTYTRVNADLRVAPPLLRV